MLRQTSNSSQSATSSGLLGWGWQNEFLAMGGVIFGGLVLFKIAVNKDLFWKTKNPVLDLDPTMVEDAKGCALKLGMPPSLVEEKLNMIETPKELVNFSLDLHQLLVVKRIHILEGGVAMAASSWQSWLTITNVFVFLLEWFVFWVMWKNRRLMAIRAKKSLRSLLD